MATVKFRLSSKCDRATGLSEILVRFFHGKIDQYAKTNIFVQPQYWNADRERVTIPRVRVMSPDAKRLTSELTDVNAKLERVKKLINDSFIEAGAGKKGIEAAWLQDLIKQYNFPGSEKSRAVLDVLK